MFRGAIFISPFEFQLQIHTPLRSLAGPGGETEVAIPLLQIGMRKRGNCIRGTPQT